MRIIPTDEMGIGPLDGDTLLCDARDWTRERIKKGVTCPCCNKLAKIYKRPMNSGQARSLISMYRLNGRGWVHLPTQVDSRSREEGKLAFWGLVEDSGEKRDDGGRSGWWRLTAKGELFVLGETTVPKYIRTYGNRLLGLTGEPFTIQDALTTRFNYEKLMRGDWDD